MKCMEKRKAAMHSLAAIPAFAREDINDRLLPKEGKSAEEAEATKYTRTTGDVSALPSGSWPPGRSACTSRTARRLW